MTISHSHIGVDVGPYYVAGFTPQALPPTAVLSTSDCNLGAPDITDEISTALSVDLGSTTRWLADPATLTDHLDGTWRWAPSAGADLNAYWEFPAANVCSTDPTYSYRIGRRRWSERAYPSRELVRPAFVFSGDQWAQLRNYADPLLEVTVVMVARLRRPYGAGRSGIVESIKVGTDPAGQSDVYLRLKHNHVRTGVRGHHRSRLLFHNHRPHILGAAHAKEHSKLLLVGAHRHLDWFHHPTVGAYDMSWYLGRLGGQYDADQTTLMDVLEVNLWSSSLTKTQLRHVTHQLNGIYKVHT